LLGLPGGGRGDLVVNRSRLIGPWFTPTARRGPAGSAGRSVGWSSPAAASTQAGSAICPSNPTAALGGPAALAGPLWCLGAGPAATAAPAIKRLSAGPGGSSRWAVVGWGGPAVYAAADSGLGGAGGSYLGPGRVRWRRPRPGGGGTARPGWAPAASGGAVAVREQASGPSRRSGRISYDQLLT